MNLMNTVVDYFRSSKNELTKVTWPSRQDTIRYSTLVIAVSVSVAAFFGLLDMGLSKLVNASLANKTFAPQPAVEQPVVPTTQPIQTETPVQTDTFDLKNATPIDATDKPSENSGTETPKF